MQESTVPSSLQASAFSGLGIPSQKYPYLVLALEANGVEIVYTENVSDTMKTKPLSFDLAYCYIA